MKRMAFAALVVAGLMAGCGSPDRDSEVAAIEHLKQKLSPREVISDDPDVVQLLEMYRTFVADFPDDSLAPVYLIEAAEMNIAIDDPMQAVALLDTAIA